jgi:Protein of unknown function (DUF1593)
MAFGSRIALSLLCLWTATYVASAQGLPMTHVDDFAGKPRVIVISDIGNEPDDQMSFVRLLLYSDELQIEAMIATTSTWQKSATHPETMRQLIDAYGQVRPNLLLHSKEYPAAQDLGTHVFAGQTTYGLAGTGKDKDSDGARSIINVLEREGDPRPVWICIWGGASTLAQALQDIRTTRTPEQVATLIAKLRVYSVSDQDDAGPWIRREFPALFYIVSPSTPTSGEYYFATWTGISGDRYYRNGAGADFTTVTNEWLDTNIRSKGPLGKDYPKFMFIMEGDTPSFLGLIDNGLNSYRRPDWGGWGGRYIFRQPYGETHPIWTQGGDEFARATSQDTVIGVDGVEHVSDQATIWRWREVFQNDFAARMTWTISDYAHANHNPIAIVNGKAGKEPIEMDVKVGQSITLDAGKSSDPDGQRIHFRWFLYQEAGSADGRLAALTLTGSETPELKVHADSPCRALWLPLLPCKGTGTAHIILAVTDEGTPRLTSYRRIILHVLPADAPEKTDAPEK